MVAATLSVTETDELKALRAFLVSILPSDVPVILGQTNRVPEPKEDTYVVFWPISQPRLGTNYTTYEDNQIIGSIAGPVLTVTDLVQGTLGAGMTLIDGTVGVIAANTVIVDQISGSTGGTGTYTVSPTQVISSSLLYADVRKDLVATEWTVQIDVHGGRGANVARVIEGLFRSEVATAFFETQGLGMAPLYCSDPKQLPFINDQQQYENRWSMDAHMQFNPIIGTPQQFATEIEITTIEAGVVYTGP